MTRIHTTNATNTLIRPAPDCTAQAKVPAKPDSIAGQQYALLAADPYTRTADDILSAVAALRADQPHDAAFRAQFHAKGQPCFRASPLTKTHGWAVHHDAQSRVALIDPTSDTFARLDSDPTVTKHDAMRNRRA